MAWRRDGSRAGLVAAAVALGFGLWVQQYILYYVVALAVTAIDWTPQGRARIREHLAARILPAWLRLVLGALAAAACVYIALGMAAFLGAGFDVTLSGVRVTVTHPQKMWWIAAALAADGERPASSCGQLAWGDRPNGVDGAGARVSPRLRAGARSDACSLTDLVRRWRAWISTGSDRSCHRSSETVLPIVFGFKSPTTERLAVPAWPALIIAIAIVVSYRRIGEARAGTRQVRHSGSGLFHVFLITTPIVFIVSGALHRRAVVPVPDADARGAAGCLRRRDRHARFARTGWPASRC